MIEKKRCIEILESIKNVNVGIIGDFCVDIYWNADMTKSELSCETPHYPLPVVAERVYPGAAGNTAANMAALAPKSVKGLSLIGDDWRGMLLKSELEKRDIDTSRFVLTPGRFTNAYCKPMRKGISAAEYEDPRLDFANYSRISKDIEEQVIAALENLAGEVDIIAVSDQFEHGIATDAVVQKIISLAKGGAKITADSRYKIDAYTNVIIKPNEVESWRAVYNNEGYLNATEGEFIKAAVELSKRNSAPVMLTLGSRGSVVVEGEKTTRVEAEKLAGPRDICGAGDTFLSAFTCALGTGATAVEAAEIAAIASTVTVQKIGVTGTATAEEIVRQEYK